MIIQAKDNVLEKSSQFKSQTFGIKNFNKAFRILIDGIYSDPFGSIMREIASNCIDANKESGTDKNVEITFVNKDPLNGDDYTIIFKDYGIGISPDRMFNIFCFLGESTKDNDNEQIGGWGLGSKSPFKYTDTYTVKTVYNNIEYLYTLVINELDVPECNLIYEKPTDVESGTEIILPVKDYNDFKSFKDAAQKQLCWFKNITFNNFSIEYPKVIYEGKRIIICENPLDNNSWGSSYSQTVILGNVPYKYTKGNNLHKRVALKFNIGELQPTASREALDYNSTTISNYDLIKKEALEELSEYVKSLNIANDFKSFYETCSSLDFNTIDYRGYSFENFKNCSIEVYEKIYWRARVVVRSMFLKQCNINNLYYYDDLSIKEIDVKNYSRDNDLTIAVIPKTSKAAIYDIIKEVATPLSSIITPTKLVRQSRKGKITFTDILKNEVNTLEISDFENKYLKPNQLVVFAKDSTEYLGKYSSYPFNHFRLTSTEINKLGVKSNLIHVNNKKEWLKWIIENKPSVRKLFIYKHFINNDIASLISKNEGSLSQYLRTYNSYAYDGIYKHLYIKLIEEHPSLQKQFKIFKLCVESLHKRESKKLKFKS